MQIHNVPQELKDCPQWLLWRLEIDPDKDKPTKRPYIAEPNAGKANVMDPRTWRSFEAAIAAPIKCLKPVAPDTPISETGYSGYGFVFKAGGPYAGVDLDNTKSLPIDQQQDHWYIYGMCDSYTEVSPSGEGVHIIVKASIPKGKRKDGIEIYSEGRFFTMTGNVQAPYKEIREAQEFIDVLYNKMNTGNERDYLVEELPFEQLTDEQVLEMARNAVNAAKFIDLWAGKWQWNYPSQSEADFALYDMLGFYCKNRQQCRRLFRQSALGQRDKAARDDYLDFMFEKTFDNSLLVADPESSLRQFNEQIAAKAISATGAPSATEPGKASEPVTQPAALATPTRAAAGSHVASIGQAVNGKSILPGLLGLISDYLYNSAPRPVRLYADVGAIGFLAGVCGRGYNVSGTGLNQYILMLGTTGTGKDLVKSGVDRIFNEVKKTVPAILDFIGSATWTSPQGLVKQFDGKPAKLFIFGEMGKKLADMVGPYANTNLKGIHTVMLQFYSKSGHGENSDSMAYSDRANNVASVASPSFTILGESVPDSIYENLDETLVSDGLLPRFVVFEFHGERSYNNYNRDNSISFELANGIGNIVATVLAAHSQNDVCNVGMMADAAKIFKDYDIQTTDLINANKASNGVAELWNRAHLKAIKLAGLFAVAVNHIAPMITVALAQHAIDIINNATMLLAVRFDSGELGKGSASPHIQAKEMARKIKSFLTKPYSDKSLGSSEMHSQAIIPQSVIKQYCNNLACFKHDRRGCNSAMNETLKYLVENDFIREMAVSQMQERFGGFGGKAYVVRDWSYLDKLIS